MPIRSMNQYVKIQESWIIKPYKTYAPTASD